ncbi:unnamed protein product [Durusdinium trenchii]|uniref:AAA+ ATPase domain-containing protein n=2 Tax=Durusdinium trenchii TaxID=1381693 RepID=A0ABP0HNM8_9DINO
MAACSVALARVDSLGVSERWPLDACALTGHCRPLLVRIPSRSVCFVFWALPSSSSRLVLPPWVSRLGVQDEDAAEVDELSSGEIQELEGPLTTPDRIQACVLFGHSGLKEAMRRQLERLPGSPPSASGAMEWHVALRLMGEVYIFKVLRVAERALPLPRIRPPRAAAADAADAAASTAAEKCKAHLQNWPRSGPLLFEGGPRGHELLPFLSALQGSWSGGEVIFVPLVELLWEMPRGIRPPMMGQLLWNLVQQMGLDEDEQGLLFLGSLDGPLPEYPELASHLWPLKGLRRCYVVGTCSSKEHVHPKLLELFHENLVELPSLGFGPARVAAPPRTPGASEGQEVLLGREALKEELQTTVVQYFTSVETFRAMGVQWPPRTLLHGPSGSGKTQLLRWLADRVAPYAEVTWLRPAEVFSRYLGESEERLRNAFAAVQNKEAAVLILEGLDEFVKPSSTDSTGVHGRLAATLLTLLDGIEGPSRTRGLAICASTRRPAVELDGRLTRPGRMDRWLRVSEPNDSERLALLQHFLERSVERRMRSCDPKMKTEMVGATAGMWPGQLRCLAQNAVSRCSISSGGKADLKDEQVWEAVLRALAPSLAPTASASSPSVPSASSLAACLARAAATELPDDDDF